MYGNIDEEIYMSIPIGFSMTCSTQEHSLGTLGIPWKSYSIDKVMMITHYSSSDYKIYYDSPGVCGWYGHHMR